MPARIVYVMMRTMPNVTRKATEARNSRERSLLARAPGDLVLDDREIIAGKSVDVALERERPVFGWPLAHIVEAIGQLFRRDPDGVVEDDVGPDVHPPWIVFVASRRSPRGGVVLVHR